MIEEITCYKTNDGKIFEDETKAEEHVINNVCENIEKHILQGNDDLKCNFGSSGLYKVIMALCGTKSKVKQLKMILNIWVD